MLLFSLKEITLSGNVYPKAVIEPDVVMVRDPRFTQLSSPEVLRSPGEQKKRKKRKKRKIPLLYKLPVNHDFF